jgi:glucose/arabinose dehydrogenase
MIFFRKDGKRLGVVPFVLLCLLFFSALRSTKAQTPPTGFSSVLVSSQWNEAVGLVFSQDGSQLFVWERGGKVWIVENGQKKLLLDISAEVGAWHDHGLLGFALHPQFEENGYFFLHYLVDRHHLINAGTGAYNATTNDYYSATIARLTRYTAVRTTTGYTVAPSTRKVLIGATKSTGIPSLERSHVTGSIVFGTDGTLLIATGDGANGAGTDVGSDPGTYYKQALDDGIITDAENVGAYRSQILNCYSGKILRIDPITGEGVPSNPFYDLGSPGAPRSKVWALGLRNPFRMILKPGTGSHNPEDGNPGVLYVGDVGFTLWEEISVVHRAGQNLGWPLYEGLTANNGFTTRPTPNYHAPNPLYNGTTCTQQYFTFHDLLKQETPSGTATFANPCNPSQGIPDHIKTFVHTRPVIDWRHGTGPSRTGTFSGSTATVINIGAAGSPVAGPQFGGNAAVGGVFYTGEDFPPEYKNRYFFGDYTGTWIRNLTISEGEKPVAVSNFIGSGAVVVAMASHPAREGLYYINFPSEIRRVYYSANRPPVAAASSDKTYGPGPLTVQFTGSNSNDPEAQPLTYAWDFGDGSTSTAPNPSHVFRPATGSPTPYTITLTVRDNQGKTDQATLVVSVNNTPPQVTITSPLDNTLYPMNGETTYQMRATVTDQEHISSQLSYRWETIMHHDDHQHPEPVDTSPETATTVSPLGCKEENYFYRIRLTVTDGAGLSTTAQVELFPNCSAFVEDVTGLTATPHDGKVRLDWINPANFTEVMIVAREGAPITAAPSGSGSAYTANLDFQGTATAFGGGKVVYKGRTSPQTIFNLANNKTYYFKVFTRISNSWSGGAERGMAPFAPIVREYWAAVPGTTVATIPLNTLPTSTSQLSAFEAPANAGDNYGARVRAYVIAPQTGNYTFWIASDDDSQLHLSTNDSPGTKRLIASVSGFTNPRDWAQYPSQKSDIVTLQAGQKYYIEALHKEGVAADHLAVGWQLPDGTLERPIPGAYLAPYVSAPGSNVPPTVTLTGPAGGSSYPAPANITLSATAADSDGTISRVEFYQGATKLGEDVTSPYSFSWTGVAAGSYTLTARAVDNANGVATSAAANVSVTTSSTGPQLVGFTLVNADTDADMGPLTNGQVVNLVTLGTRNLNVRANTSPATIGSVVFNLSGTQVRNHTESGAPYALFGDNAGNYGPWTPAPGNYSLKATPFAAGGGTGTAGTAMTIGFSVVEQSPGNQLPTVTLTGPVSGSSYTAPASITLSATAADSDGTISRVEFYRGTTKLGEDATAPYSFSWTGVAAGSYTLTARAVDNATGIATSAAVFISVKSTSLSTSFYRALNLNGAALTIDNNPWQASRGAAGFSYTTNGGVFAAPTIPLVPATDANRASMIRSSIWGSSVSLALGGVPAGSYDVWLYVWEDNLTQTYSIRLEGVVVQANYVSGSAGAWKKLGPYRTTITDGTLNIASSGGHANLSGLEVWKVNTAARRGEVSGEVSPPRLVSVYPNPSGGDVTVRYYAADEGKVAVQITDVLSRKVLQTNVAVKPGYNVAVLPTAGFAPGIYQLNLHSGSEQVTKKIIIAR